MRAVLALVLFLLSQLAVAQAVSPAAPAAGQPSVSAPLSLSSYRLGIGDIITVKVFGEDDLSREKVKVTDAGTVAYPVLGEIKVLGRTVGELEKLVADGLRGRYLVNPRVSVFVDEYRPFFVDGQVARTGGYPYQPGLNVAKAISLAGGLRERASVNKMFVIREGDKPQNRIKVDMSTDVRPGDILVIEESFF
jgi:polysaccharide export outer membrane protein